MSDINSNNIANSKSFNVSMIKVLEQANLEIDTHPYLNDIVDLNEDLQLESFKILWLSFKNVMRDKVANMLDINLPYIGYLKIKYKNRFAIIRKVQVAKELGYINWIDIPKDKLIIALARVKELTNADIIAEQSKGVRKRDSHQPITKPRGQKIIKVINNPKPKVFKIKLPKT